MRLSPYPKVPHGWAFLPLQAGPAHIWIGRAAADSGFRTSVTKRPKRRPPRARSARSWGLSEANASLLHGPTQIRCHQSARGPTGSTVAQPGAQEHCYLKCSPRARGHYTDIHGGPGDTRRRAYDTLTHGPLSGGHGGTRGCGRTGARVVERHRARRRGRRRCSRRRRWRASRCRRWGRASCGR